MMTNNQTDFRALCAEVYAALEAHSTTRDDEVLLDRVGTALRLAQLEPEGPTDDEIMRLMPQQMHEDLAAAARALAEQASTISPYATGIMRIILNRHAVDLARAVLARWGDHSQHGCARLS